MHWDFLVGYLISKFTFQYIHNESVYIHLFRFVDADGNNYDPRKLTFGPYGLAYVFAGPKVSVLAIITSNYYGTALM